MVLLSLPHLPIPMFYSVTAFCMLLMFVTDMKWRNVVCAFQHKFH